MYCFNCISKKVKQIGKAKKNDDQKNPIEDFQKKNVKKKKYIYIYAFTLGENYVGCVHYDAMRLAQKESSNLLYPWTV